MRALVLWLALCLPAYASIDYLEPPLASNPPSPASFRYYGHSWEDAVLHEPNVILILWGDWEKDDPQSIIVDRLLANVSGSKWLGILDQYCDHVPFRSTRCKGGRRVQPWIHYQGIQHMPGSVPAVPTVDDVIGVAFQIEAQVLPGTVVVVMNGPGSRPEGLGRDFCAWHAWVGFPVIFVPYLAGEGACWGLDGVSIVASHELAETITDPRSGSGWHDGAMNEVSDLCAWKFADWVPMGDEWIRVDGVWDQRKRECRV